jgi:predicted ATPase
MAHLRSVALRKPGAPGADARPFPFSVPVIRTLETVDLDCPVTFFVGENGSGKSTLLEGIASAAGLPTVGSDEVARDATLAAQRTLAKELKLVWNHRTRRGFFLRAEDFFGFAKSLAKLRADLLARIGELDTEYATRTAWAKGLAQGPAYASLADMERRYGVDLDANSHGQSFLKLFQSRFVPGGLYLLDEPEAPLSPQSQLALMAMMMDMVRQDAQFIIATHSPILLGYPDPAEEASRKAYLLRAALFRDGERPQGDEGRPQPQFKRLRACFPKVYDPDTEKPTIVSGTIEAFTWAHGQVSQRRRPNQPLIRMMDGQNNLWEMADTCLESVPPEETIERRLAHGGGHTGWSRAWIIAPVGGWKSTFSGATDCPSSSR